MDNKALLIDGIIVLVFLAMVLVSYARGFIKSLTPLASLAAALAAAILLSMPAANLLYNTGIAPKVEKAISSSVEKAGTTASQALDGALEKIPGFMKNALGEQSGADLIKKASDVGGTAQEVAQKVADKVIRPAGVSVLRAICFVLLLLLGYIAARIAFSILNFVAKLPLLKSMDKILGLFAGIILGAVWALILSAALYVVASTGAFGGVLSTQALDGARLTSALVKINPIINVLRNLLPIK